MMEFDGLFEAIAVTAVIAGALLFACGVAVGWVVWG